MANTIANFFFARSIFSILSFLPGPFLIVVAIASLMTAGTGKATAAAGFVSTAGGGTIAAGGLQVYAGTTIHTGGLNVVATGATVTAGKV